MRANAQSGGDFEKPPEGYHKARCIRVIDLGTQEGQYKGNATYKRQLMLMFELPEVLFEWEGEKKPALISKKYNLTFSSKATLRKDMESWYGKKFNDADIEKAGGFDPAKVAGRPAKIQVTHSDDGQYANIGVIIPEDQCPPQVHPTVIIDLDDLSVDAWDGLSENMQNWIAKSPEFQELKNAVSNAATSDSSDDLFTGGDADKQTDAFDERNPPPIDDDDIPF